MQEWPETTTPGSLGMIRGFPHIAANPNSKVIFATAVWSNLAQILSEKSAPISLQLLEDPVLRRARKLDRDAGGENALELHPSLFDRNDTVSFII